MAKKKIAKTLLVGLGGTGNLALKYAKKRFYEMYGDGKPFSEFELPLIEYLALDTSIDDLKLGVGLNLTNQEKLDLIAFLKTLTDHDYITVEYIHIL